MSKSSDELPPIVALFVSAFHVKEGYKIIWRKSDRNLTGCEYKTLPSGIDRVQEDVIYFTHDTCLGIAAYQNLQTGGTARQTYSCVSIAVLVLADAHNLRHQRLNKIWLYNSVLRDLIKSFDINTTQHSALDEFYSQQTIIPKRVTQVSRPSSPPASPVLSSRSIFPNYQSFRSERQNTQTKSVALLPAQELSNLHPVLSLPDCISLFGPLIFPVYRAALARKRILLLTEAPVQRACHFIYNLQLISAIPNNASTMRRPSPLRQLFSLGLADIPLLESLSNQDGEDQGWIGISTDQIFESKTDLWDVLIKLPSEEAGHDLAKQRARPNIVLNDGTRLLTSYLDSSNFQKLKPFLPLYRDTGLKVRPEPSFKRSVVDSIVSGFWYWASAGQFLQPDEEIFLLQPESADETIQQEEEDGEDRPLMRRTLSVADKSKHVSNGRDEVIILVLFNRLTSNIMNMLDELSCESVDELKISREQMVKIGLTPRLPIDVKLIEALGLRWFGREVIVDKSFWPCC